MRIAGLLVLGIFFLPAFACAAELININTADATVLDTLPGVGAVIAERIIDYRTVHGSFATIEDLQKVSGIGSGSTYEKIAPLITVGGNSTPSNTESDSATASSTQSVSESSENATAYTSPPSALFINISGNPNAILGVPFRLSARATTKNGVVDTSAQISWGLGDGSSAIGSAIEKTYRYAGTYLVIVDATNGVTTARDEIVVTVKSATVHISAVSSEGITVSNDSNERLDLSGWRLTSTSGSFRFPEGTVLLPNASVLFPFVVMNWPVTFNASLTYPDGLVAAPYVPSATSTTEATNTTISSTQPSPTKAGYEQVQTVEPIIRTQTNIQAHEETVTAPAAATELAAAGAAVPSVPAANNSRVSGIFHSPWTFGLLAVILIAGGAFIFL
jgi:competence ComEA-like helix-hairpin-helix protein